MKRTVGLCFVLILVVSCTTGCWNLKEPDEVAFVVGAGLDLTKDGQLELSSQIAIPSSLGGGQEGGGGIMKQNFRVESSIGKNVYDTVPRNQTKISRKIFAGHRQIILVGQTMAEHGISDVLDQFVRLPQSELRSKMYVVKDGQAKDILSTEPSFEPLTSTALVLEQKTLGLKSYYFREFLTDTLSQGVQPLLPAISLTASKKLMYTGTAIFNKDDGLKLAGFLNMQESSIANWITNRQTHFTVTSTITEGGTVSLKLQSLSRSIRASMVGKQIHIFVHLTGEGIIFENNTKFNPSKRKDLLIIQNELDQTTQKSVQLLIEKVQKQYKTDIFGFGKTVHRQYPYQWKTVKRNWNETFSKLHVSITVELHCVDPGQANSSIMNMHTS
ncbi:Ger(x)C family spore germination protein [Paenibacillus sp. MWE-103]|uniref:Ger(X)C family spore germination protein n=1 Tax=Paenibacillus artemisiicola TaxID=1172618 RepID=A0ABS3W4F8_9BACL|nr:Ger(x)C family spore germination protein [Paenibacillus artemisiicola]MBO7743172.1 Ger(x)C family spore germination protein [Paenibacillus artemisiicola]